MKSLSIITLLLTSAFAIFFFGRAKQSSKLAIFNTSEPTFEDFIKSFKKKKGPFAVTAEDLSKYYYTKENLKINQKQAIPEKFGAVLPDLSYGEFRRTPKDHQEYYLAKLDEHTILYISSTLTYDYGVEGEMKEQEGDKYVMCHLVTFDQNGKKIEKSRMASIGNVRYYYSFSVDKKKIFTRRKYKYIYKEDVDEVGYYNNEVIATKFVEAKRFYINRQGEIKELHEGAKATVSR